MNQVITTYGPGAMVDLPDDSVIIGGLEGWKYFGPKIPVIEPRLLQSLREDLGTSAPEYLYEPPKEWERDTPGPGINVWRFPEWYVVQKVHVLPNGTRRRRLVHKSQLNDRRKFQDDNGKKYSVVPVRFVRACENGHVDDIKWREFVHGTGSTCHRPLWIEERRSSGTLSDTFIRCDCGESQSMSVADNRSTNALGFCNGRRPWLGPYSNESCKCVSQLLIRSASNAYFRLLKSVISIPDAEDPVVNLIGSLWEKGLNVVASGGAPLSVMRQIPDIGSALQKALISAELCSSDPVCSHELPNHEVRRELLASACHGCLLVAETSCEQQNRFLDRTLVVPTLVKPDLKVSLFIDFPRQQNDTTLSAQIVARYRHQFIEEQWPGGDLPELYYFKPSLAMNPTDRASMHAKLIISDQKRVFVTSANLTKAAQHKNIEIGVLLDDEQPAQRLANYFKGLADRGDFVPF